MNILFLSRWFPYPPDNGSKVRIYNLLRILARNHQVTLLSFNDQPEKPAEVDGLKNVCAEIVIVPWKDYQPTSIRAVFGLLSSTPRALIDTFSPEMAAKIRQLTIENQFALIIASQIEMASYRPYWGTHTAIFEEVEVGVPLGRRKNSKTFLSRLRNDLTWQKHKYYLAQLLKNFPLCTVVSDEENKLLQETGIREQGMVVVPNWINLEDYTDFLTPQKQNTIIFTGSFRYKPNYEAMVWFIGKVFPAILEHFPDIQLIITGDHLNLPLPAQKNVLLTGYLDDIRPIIASAAVSIVPLRSGGGTRLKILEAMALRTPVVSTPKGAEGICIKDGKDILIADTPLMFAQSVITLLRDTQLRDKLVDNGFNLIREKYSTEAIAFQVNTLLNQLPSISTLRS